MKRGVLHRILTAVGSAVLWALLVTMAAARAWAVPLASRNDATTNHLNVVMVVDASGSMRASDPNNLRFEALNQFASLLSEKGNKLGGVVFTQQIAATQDMELLDAGVRDAVITSITDVPAEGDTNIGAALEEAVRMIGERGDPKLASVVLLLSDGNTDLPSDEELQASLDAKAQGVQQARDAGIRVYSVCLNADGSADLSELDQISAATGGESREVRQAEDLQEVFNWFYQIIYGTNTVPLANEILPNNGILTKEFSVPAMGVEEANILIYGNVESYDVQREDGSRPTIDKTDAKTFTLLKLPDITPGNYTLVTKGVPGDRIRIDLVYNAVLDIDASMQPASGSVNPQDPIYARVELRSGDQRATSEDDLEGYEAELLVLDPFEQEIESVPMEKQGGVFEVDHVLPEGSYRFKARVFGNNVERTSGVIGSLNVSAEELTEAEKNNTPPKPVEDPVEESVLIWPFVDNSLSLDLSALATDKEDDTLQYKVISSSFMDDDYSISNGDVLTITNFSMSVGEFVIRAVDRFGASCDITVRVTSRDVGVMALIGMGIAALAGIVAFFIMLRIALRKPFRGDITVEMKIAGKSSLPKKITGRRGRIPLAMFDLEPMGLDLRKSYFQATGESYVLLRTNEPVTFNSTKTKEVRIESGARVNITVSEGNVLIVRFDSRMQSRGPRRSGRRAPTMGRRAQRR